MENQANDNRVLNSIVQEVISEAHIDPSLILPEEIEYIREHVLKKPLRVVHIWALGVGVVIAGMYFGWNFGLPVAGPVGMLIASLIVCGLYLTWVLGLSELSVAMPFAGGPMAYGRRALGKGFGFFMGWSMFLESLFAAIGTALATGGYVAFLLNPDHPDKTTTTICAVVCAIVFMAVQYVGVKEQAVVMLWLTWAAIGALVWFWAAAIPGVSLDRVFTTPLLPNGWSGVLRRGSVCFVVAGDHRDGRAGVGGGTRAAHFHPARYGAGADYVGGAGGPDVVFCGRRRSVRRDRRRGLPAAAGLQEGLGHRLVPEVVFGGGALRADRFL